MYIIPTLPPIKRVLDFSNCKTWGEVHGLIQRELELPEWYGQNLDALWDSLTGIMYLPAEITVIYKPETEKSKELAEEIDKIIEVIQEAVDKYHEITLQVEK